MTGHIKWLRRDRLYIVAVILLGLVSHYSWLNFTNTFTHTDWDLWPLKAVVQSLHASGTWINFFDLGAPNIQINFFGFISVWSILSRLGFSYNFDVWLTFLMPIAILSFLSPFLLGRKLFGDRNVALFASLFYGTVIYFLARQDSHLPMVFIFALTPLIFLALLNAVEENRLVNWLYITLLVWISSIYELRVTLVVLCILVVYVPFLGFEKVKACSKNILVSIVFFSLLSMFWVLPTVLGGLSSSIAQVANRGVFGNSLFDLAHALTIYDSSWTGAKPNGDFINQPVMLYMWLIPCLAWSSLFFLRNQTAKTKRIIFYFAILSLLGIFLTKQSDPPLGYAYQYLYDNLPGFKLFREASKFYLITGFGYLGLIGFTLLGINSVKNKAMNTLYICSLCIILLVATINLKPLIFRELGMLQPRSIPSDYTTFNKLIDSSWQTFRVGWLPTASRWATYDINHPRLSIIGLLNLEAIRNNTSVPFSTDNNSGRQSIDFMKQPIAKPLLSAMNVRYIAVPLRDTANDDDFYKYYGNDPQLFIDTLDMVPWLKKINIGTQKLTVYENPNYKPYFSASTTLFDTPIRTNLNDLYAFSTDQLQQQDFPFTVPDMTVSVPGIKFGDIFANIQPQDFNKGVLSANVAKTSSSNLYINTNHPVIYYKTTANSLTVYESTSNFITINGNAIAKNMPGQVIKTLAFKPKRDYYFGQAEQLSTITVNTTRYLGAINNNPSIYSTEGNNLVLNPSFESGLWQKKVGDCNNYATNGHLGMTLDTSTSADGQKSLQLKTDSHTACVSAQPISITPQVHYKFEFSYKTISARQVGYVLSFNDDAHTVIRDQILVANQNWNQFSRLIQAPLGATQVTIQLLGYPGDQLQLPTATNYDEVILQRLFDEGSLNVNTIPSYTRIPITNNDKVTYQDQAYSYNNQLSDPSFESGLWQKKVGDCNNYDDQPILAMKLDTQDHTDGKKSLELDATKHTACINHPAVQIRENSAYYLSFDYSSPNNATAAYYAYFNDPSGTSYTEQLPTNNSKWQSFSKIIKTPVDATTMNLILYAYSDSYGTKKMITRYDNFRLIQIPDIQNTYFQVGDMNTNMVTPKSINFTFVGSNKKTVHIHSAKTAFYLSMSEAYNPKWQLEIDNAKAKGLFNNWLPWTHPDKVPTKYHYQLDTFANGWYIDVNYLCKQHDFCTRNGDGSYNIALQVEFTPQRWFYTGLLVTGFTLGSLVLYIFFMRAKPKRTILYQRFRR